MTHDADKMTALDYLTEHQKEVADDLKERIVRRGRTKANPCELDLRSSRWTGVSWAWKTMRYPGAPGWPDAGPVITDPKDAESPEVLAAYAKHLAPMVRVARTTPGLSIPTVEEAIDALVEYLEEVKGKNHNTTIQWGATLRKHLGRPHGGKPLTILTRAWVGNLLSNMKVRAAGGGTKPAADRTKDNLRAAMTALWRKALPTVEPPFAGVTYKKEEDESAQRRREAEQNSKPQGKKTAYSPRDMLEVLGWAMYLDKRNIIEKPNVAVRRVPNTTEAIALQFGLITRIEELAFLRRGHFHADWGGTYIPGTKTAHAQRYVVWFDSVVPWIERLLRIAPPEDDAFVFRIDPRDTRRDSDGKEIWPSPSTLGSRIAQVLKCSGHKHPRQNTHIFRDTAITRLKSEGLDTTTLKSLVGHAPMQGVTVKYFHAEVYLRQLPDDIRGHLSSLPTPEEVEDFAALLEAREAYERWVKGD